MRDAMKSAGSVFPETFALQNGTLGATRTRRWLDSPLVVAAVLLMVGFASRAVQLGNPVIQVDDQFYLMVAHRMWEGALPYVDIWDRKPIGLFLIYAAIRLLGGEGIVQYQIVATLFAVATAFVVSRIADRIAPRRGALIAGMAYLLFLGMFGGDGGQSPVFYNLFVALAALAIVRIVERPGFDSRTVTLAGTAMLLMGIAMQIKYTAMFEGAYFGTALMWKAHREGVTLRRVAANAALWLALAVLPTALAWGYYSAIGHGDAFYYANFSSIFERSPEPAGLVFGRLLAIAARISPLALAAALSRWPRRIPAGGGQASDSAVHGFVAAWAVAAILGMLAFGSYFDHYALPMLAPLAIAAAPLLGDFRTGLVTSLRGRTRIIPVAFLILAFGGALSARIVDLNRSRRGDGEEARAIASFVAPRLQGSCLFVYDGEPILYELTHSCLPTRWPFPDHLNSWREDHAIGVDSLAETRRIMASEPRLVISTGAPGEKTNLRTWSYMQGVLAADYRPAAQWAIGHTERIVYQRKRGV